MRNNMFKTFGSKATAGMKRFGYKHGDKLCVAAGLICGGIALYKAFKAGPKLEKTITKHKEKVAEMKKSQEETGVVNHKEVLKTYKDTAVEICAEAGPAVLWGVASAGFGLSAYGIIKKRLTITAANLKTVNDAFTEYRKRVRQDQGEEKDLEYRFGVKEETVKEKVVNPDTGEETVKEKKQRTANDIGVSDFAKYYMKGCREWDPDPYYNMVFLQSTQRRLNDKFHTYGYLFVNDMYDALGIPRTPAGQIAGWIKGHGDQEIKLGLYPIEKIDEMRLSGQSAILIDPNCLPDIIQYM